MICYDDFLVVEKRTFTEEQLKHIEKEDLKIREYAEKFPVIDDLRNEFEELTKGKYKLKYTSSMNESHIFYNDDLLLVSYDNWTEDDTKLFTKMIIKNIPELKIYA